MFELETLIVIGSYAAAIDAIYGLYRTISGIFQDKGENVKETVKELRESGILVKQPSNHIFIAPNLEAVKNLNQSSQQHITNLQDIHKYLDPIQNTLGNDILSSRMIPTPEKFLKEIRKNPWDVFSHIRPFQYTRQLTDSSYIPMMFEYKGNFYIGWIKRGLLPSVTNCNYNELWLPKTSRKKHIKKKLTPGYEDNINHGIKPNIYKKISNWYFKRTGYLNPKIANIGRYIDKNNNIIYKYKIYPIPTKRLINEMRISFNIMSSVGTISPSQTTYINCYTTKNNKIRASYLAYISKKWSQWYEI